MVDTTVDPVKETSPRDVETSPAGTVKRWLAELDLAHAAEKAWREEGKRLWEMYEAEKAKPDSFNILWSNTETLAPAVYNSTPNPDVRRRFKDADPAGKAVSQILERELSYQMDAYDFDEEVCAAVLNALVVGRGLLRVKYEPTYAPQSEAPIDPAVPPPEPQVIDETVSCDSVQWDDFRHGPGKTWSELPWIAFRHDFTRDMAERKFGAEIAGALKYSKTDDATKIRDPESRALFETAEAWEVWDKDTRRVLFIATDYKIKPCLVADDPLELVGFWPCPRPLYAINNSRTLVPVPLYRMYAEQAKELTRLSNRINKITLALKLRGAYAANLKELKSILEADDLAMTPVQNVSELASIGGLDKALWMMPVDGLIRVLQGLYVARDQAKQAIYEISGLSDILRGATDAGETATAQRIKSQWGSVRLRKLQREVQRMIRDTLRIKGEVICQSFSQETLAAQTNVQLPTAQQKQQAQMAAQQAQMMGQPMPPEMQDMLALPSWDEVMQVMRSDALRTYRVDIETDSTVSDTLDPEMAGLSETLDAVGKVFAMAGPGVEAGFVPVEVPKEISLAIVRRARMGLAVEDAIEKIEQPPPPMPPPPAPPPEPSVDPQEVKGLRDEIAQLSKQLQQLTQMAKTAETAFTGMQ